MGQTAKLFFSVWQTAVKRLLTFSDIPHLGGIKTLSRPAKVIVVNHGTHHRHLPPV